MDTIITKELEQNERYIIGSIKGRLDVIRDYENRIQELRDEIEADIDRLYYR